MTVADARARPAVFFDRDGVLNHDDGYTHRPEDLRWTDGAMDAVRFVREQGYLTFVVTNQSGVARGLYDEAAVLAFHAEMQRQLATVGTAIDDLRYCPYHPEAAVPAYRRAHPDRKPAPGMILGLLDAWPVDRARSFVIGDKASDIAAAEAAGLPGFLYTGGNLLSFVRPILAHMSERLAS